MTHEEIKAAIERLGRHSKEDNSADAVICRLMDSSGWLVPDFRYALISLLQQADPATHVELPKDYNGETVGIGDKVEHLYNGRWSAPFEIAELRLRPSGWMARSEDGGAVITETCRRYQPTVEDILHEFATGILAIGIFPTDDNDKFTQEKIAEYAAKLREVMDDE